MNQLQSVNAGTKDIWELYSKELLYFIEVKIKDRYQAKDLLQDVFIKVHLQLHTLKDQEKLRPWLFQVARNTIKDHWRKQKHHSDLNDEHQAEKGEPGVYDRLRSCLPGMFQKLQPEQQQLLQEIYFKDQKQVSKSRQHLMSYSGIKSRVQRARQKLLSYISECCTIIKDRAGRPGVLEPCTKCACAQG